MVSQLFQSYTTLKDGIIICFLKCSVNLKVVSVTKYSSQKRQSETESEEEWDDDYPLTEREWFGKVGENRVADMLSRIVSEYQGKAFDDFTFMDENGYSSNIDHILVCGGGVFVIETKANRGSVSGWKNDMYWYAEKEYL